MILGEIHKHYPKAIDSHHFVNRIYDRLCRDYKVAPRDIMLAQSICSDDVNNIEYPEEGQQMLGPFNLGGLDSYPFAGLIGMGAFSKHVPDDGAALVFYAPHIGVSSDGYGRENFTRRATNTFGLLRGGGGGAQKTRTKYYFCGRRERRA